MDPSLTFGWASTGGLFLGVTYDAWSTTTSGGSATTASYTNYGPTVGYIATDWHIFGTYLASASYSYANGSATTTYTGAGTRVEIGYQFSIGNLILGPSLVYDSRSFSKQTSPSSMTLTNNVSMTDILPFFTIGFLTK